MNTPVATASPTLFERADSLRAAFDALQTNVFVADADLTLVYANPRALETMSGLQEALQTAFGLNVADLLGGSIHRFHRDPAAVEAVLRNPRALPAETDLTFAGVVLQTRIDVIRGPDGESLGWIACWEDVTEARAAAAQLQTSIGREKRAAGELRIQVRTILEVLEDATRGDLTRQIPITGDTTVGRLGEAIQRLLDGLRQDVQAIEAHASHLTTAAGELTLAGQGLAQNAVETCSQAQAAAHGSERVRDNTHCVSAGAEELHASIKEIAANSCKATDVASQAVRLADAASHTLEELGTSSTEIGKVLKLINTIAQQTNLLALNATIEAARAGDAGRGFAVVANEVKELAKQTAAATDDIHARVEAIQNNSTTAIESVQTIRTIIHEVHDLQETTAAAVEEQTATTNEMAQNVSDAAEGSAEITEGITAVAQVAEDTAARAQAVEQLASGIGSRSGELRDLLERYRCVPDAPDLLPWTADLKIGVEHMDAQHQILVSLINSVNRAIQRGAPQETIGEILSATAEYTQIHFAIEEDLLAEHDYDDLVPHQAKHRKLIDQVVAYQQRLRSGEEVGPELLQFLQRWLKGHILGTDKEYAKVLNARGVY